MLMLTIVTETFSRTESGKSWKSQPDETEIDTVPWYSRDVPKDARYGEDLHRKITNEDTLKWFRRIGGSERAERSSTPAGYIVTRLVSTSPERTLRRVRRFRITDITHADETR